MGFGTKHIAESCRFTFEWPLTIEEAEGEDPSGWTRNGQDTSECLRTNHFTPIITCSMHISAMRLETYEELGVGINALVSDRVAETDTFDD
jgi:hypothetical protein